MTPPALELRDVRKSFGTTEIIRGADLSVLAGERFALIGPNGAGKSTLFNLISGRAPVSSGEILLKGRPLAGLGPDRIHHMGLARSFQITNVFHRLSVYDNLRCAVLWSVGRGYSFWQRLDQLRAVRERAEATMEQIGLAPQRDVEAGLLSYAAQRALEIGITIAGGADVILLDEPTAGMSRSESGAAIGLIRKVTEGRTLVMVEHDMEVVFGLADRIAVLVYGQVIACGSPEQIRADPAVQEAYLGVPAGASA
jgi:branched-chain amino acid transport system ATP-binding protein